MPMLLASKNDSGVLKRNLLNLSEKGDMGSSTSGEIFCSVHMWSSFAISQVLEIAFFELSSA
jgi:hypothetical protein